MQQVGLVGRGFLFIGCTLGMKLLADPIDGEAELVQIARHDAPPQDGNS